MNRVSLAISIVIASIVSMAVVGCGNEKSASIEPLTIEQWSAMSHEEKFTSETLARLKASVAEFEDKERWQMFLIKESTPTK